MLSHPSLKVSVQTNKQVLAYFGYITLTQTPYTQKVPVALDQSSSLGSKLLWADTIDFSFSSFVVLQSRRHKRCNYRNIGHCYSQGTGLA